LPDEVWPPNSSTAAIGVLLVAYAAGLAGLATLPVVAKLVQ
jgi:hypothetical protein